ncbi:hypothetical protein KW791_00235 [Candidatus Parcubacteria bacterium]|nr:hypothetical protein [Candidatus Parcubacteria bacterium]
MNFKWEKIHTQREEGVYWFSTYRAKIFGGWLVRNFDLTKQDMRDGSFDKIMSTSESCVFVPDPEHKWSVEDEDCKPSTEKYPEGLKL